MIILKYLSLSTQKDNNFLKNTIVELQKILSRNSMLEFNFCLISQDQCTQVKESIDKDNIDQKKEKNKEIYIKMTENQSLPKSIRESIHEEIDQNKIIKAYDSITDVIESLFKKNHEKIFILLDRKDEFVKLILERTPRAKWGITTEKKLAFVYKENPDKFIIWHEILHLFGAEDCYEEYNLAKKKKDCRLKNCIMRYDPSPDTIQEKKIFICEKNIKLIKNL